jgi:serine/threonine protein kinase
MKRVQEAAREIFAYVKNPFCLLDTSVPPKPSDTPENGVQGYGMLQERYQIMMKLGEGGNGVVFSAWDIVTRTSVAIKLSAPGDRLAARNLRVRASRHGLYHGSCFAYRSSLVSSMSSMWCKYAPSTRCIAEFEDHSRI